METNKGFFSNHKIAVIVIAVIACLALAFSMSGGGGTKAVKTVKMPDVTGMTASEAKTKLENKGFSNVKTEDLYGGWVSDEEKDVVWKQSVKAGKKLKSDKEIVLVALTKEQKKDAVYKAYEGKSLKEARNFIVKQKKFKVEYWNKVTGFKRTDETKKYTNYEASKYKVTEISSINLEDKTLNIEFQSYAATQDKSYDKKIEKLSDKSKNLITELMEEHQLSKKFAYNIWFKLDKLGCGETDFNIDELGGNNGSTKHIVGSVDSTGEYTLHLYVSGGKTKKIAIASPTLATGFYNSALTGKLKYGNHLSSDSTILWDSTDGYQNCYLADQYIVVPWKTRNDWVDGEYVGSY